MTRHKLGSPDWQPIETCPADEDVSLLVSDAKGEYRLPFNCKRTSMGWVNALTGSLLSVEPVKWHPPTREPPQKPKYVPPEKRNDLT
jgi:hypothetical protein